MFYLRKRGVYRQEADENNDAGGAPAGDNETGEGASQTEGQTEGQTQGADPEVEAKARKMGWTPKEEFRGDPAKWRDAAEFVERGENMLPILRKTVEKQQAELAELKKSIKEFAEYHNKVEQRAYAKAYGELKARQMEAVASGNTEEFKQIDQDIEELQKEVSSKKPITVPEDKPKIDPAYIEWASRNKWVDTDPKMLAYGEAQFEYICRTNPEMTYAQQLEEVAKAVRKEFPDKFSNPRRNTAPSVEGTTATTKKTGKTFTDMPKEAQEVCMRMEKYHNIKRADYVKTFFEE